MKKSTFTFLSLAILAIGTIGIIWLINENKEESSTIETTLTQDSDSQTSSQNSGQTGSSEDSSSDTTATDIPSTNTTMVMFHNGTGPMCVEAVEFFEENNIEYEEHLTSDPDFSAQLLNYKAEFDNSSEGVSDSFGYYPMIFLGDRAFSGFNNDIGEEILKLTQSAN